MYTCSCQVVVRQSLSGRRRQAVVVMPSLGPCRQDVFVRLSSSGRRHQTVAFRPLLSGHRHQAVVVVRPSSPGRCHQIVVVWRLLADRYCQDVGQAIKNLKSVPTLWYKSILGPHKKSDLSVRYAAPSRIITFMQITPGYAWPFSPIAR